MAISEAILANIETPADIFSLPDPLAACDCPASGGGCFGGTCSSGVDPRNGWPVLSQFDIPGAGLSVVRHFMAGGPDIGAGNNWGFQEWPYLAYTDNCARVAVVGLQGKLYWFDNKSDGVFAPTFDQCATLCQDPFVCGVDAGCNNFRMKLVNGDVYQFNTLGVFQKFTDAGGKNVIELASIAANSFNPVTIRRTYQEGSVSKTEELQFDYEATVDGNGNPIYFPQLNSITLVQGSSLTKVAKSNYTYYGAGNSFGETGDLQTATSQVWDGAAWKNTGVSYYIYYKESVASSSSSSSSSSASLGGGGLLTVPAEPRLKYVLGPGAYDDLTNDPGVTDPLTATEAQVADYADQYLEYDAASKVSRVELRGGAEARTFTYEQSAFADGPNNWRYKTTETRSDGAKTITYMNYAGQTMLDVFQSGTEKWSNFTEYDAKFAAVMQASPAAISGYDETKADLLNESAGLYQYLNNTAGQIHLFQRDAASGEVTLESIKQGEQGAEIKLRELEYTSVTASSGVSSSSSSSSSSLSGGGSIGGVTVYRASQETVYPSDTDQTKKLITAYDYTYHLNTTQVLQQTATPPAVPTSQNGSGISPTTKQIFDEYGNPTWSMNALGVISYNQYDIRTGALLQTIEDVDTTLVGNEPLGWITPTGGGAHLVTDHEIDDFGRATQTLGPAHTVDLNGAATSVRRASWTIHDDVNHQQRSAQGYATGAGWTTFTLVNPVGISKQDSAGRTLEQIQATRASTSGKLLASDAFAQSSYVRWSTTQYSGCCQQTSQRVYHTIPATGEGSAGTNYDQTTFGFDSLNRQNMAKSPGGTITRTVFDARGNAVKTYIGTNDASATASDPTGGGAQGNNMVLVSELEFDNATGGGDNLLTKQTQYVS